MKFERTQYNSIDGQPKVRFTPTVVTDSGGAQLPFSIEASRQGIKIEGKLEISDYPDLEPFAKAMGDAWKDHKRLLPKISTSLTGH